MVGFPENQDPFLPFHDFSLETRIEEEEEDDEGSVVILGKGSPENLRFEWVISDWSKCSESCGGNGLQVRVIHCIVKLHNATQRVDNNLCEDAGLVTPDTYRKCGLPDCPKWVVSEWSTCVKSKCFRLNTGIYIISYTSYFSYIFTCTIFSAMQRRDVKCQIGNNVTVNFSKCNANMKPTHRQECFNAKCIGKWKVGSWSEVSILDIFKV